MKTVLSYLLALLVSLLIFLGLPLLGWGIPDIPGFFASPARLTYAIVIFALQIFAIAYNPQAGRNQEKRKSGLPQRRSDLILIQALSFAVVLQAPFSDSRSLLVYNYGEVGRFLGFLLIIPGFILMQAAERYLGKQFSVEVTLQEGHQLIQSRPYKILRHPRYLGMLAFFLGISLVFRSLLATLLVALLLLVLFWRVRAEEALMRGEFGQEWDEYCARSWRMIPFLF